MKPNRATILALFVALLSGLVHAQVSLKDKAQVVVALTASPPCCVIDARAKASREQDPLADALVYRAKLKIKPTATVVVIADRDDDALAVGTLLAKRHPGKPIIAVKGGLATWKLARLAMMSAAGMDAAMSGPVSFVIPANTCEHGEPLQVLRPNKK